MIILFLPPISLWALNRVVGGGGRKGLRWHGWWVVLLLDSYRSSGHESLLQIYLFQVVKFSDSLSFAHCIFLSALSTVSPGSKSLRWLATKCVRQVRPVIIIATRPLSDSLAGRQAGRQQGNLEHQQLFLENAINALLRNTCQSFQTSHLAARDTEISRWLEGILTIYNFPFKIMRISWMSNILRAVDKH